VLENQRRVETAMAVKMGEKPGDRKKSWQPKAAASLKLC